MNSEPSHLRWGLQGVPETAVINLDYRKTFWEINFLRLMHPQIIVKEIQSDDVQRNRGSRWSRKDEDKSHK